MKEVNATIGEKDIKIILSGRVDSNLRYEMETDAENDNLPKVLAFLEQHMEAIGCSPKNQIQISVAAEEIFVNIANYAYKPNSGKATIRIEIAENPTVAYISFLDSGKPFDPTRKLDPNITLSAEERQIGGLGIFMTKKMMDEVRYEYVDGKNVLTLKKAIK